MKRSLGFWRSWAMTVGCMIGSGIFLLPAVLAPYGSYSLLGWIFAGGGTLIVALTLGKLAHRIPRIGGPYAYALEAFGDLPAFLIAWGYWISQWAAVAAVAVAFSGYLGVFIPAFGSDPVVGALGSLFVIWLFAGINIAGVRAAGIVQLVTTLLKLIPLLLVGLLGLVAGEVTSIPATNPDGEPIVLLIAGVVILTMWAYSGVEAATVPADDVVDPARTIPRALVAGTLTATAVYILATMGVMALVPQETLATSTAPFADAATAVLGPWGTKFVAAGAIVSILGALNVLVLIASQVPRAAAIDRLFPSRFERLNKRGAPAYSLVIAAGLASILIFLNYSKGLVAAFELLLLLATLMTLVPYAVSAAAELWLQRRDRKEGNPVRVGAVLVALGAMAFSIFAIVGSGKEVVMYGLLLGLAGLPVYAWIIRSRALHRSEKDG